MISSKKTHNERDAVGAQSLIKEKQYTVAFVVLAQSIVDAVEKARYAEPVSITLIDFPEEKGTVGFSIHDRG